MEANLCKCNKCGSILLDKNPQVDAKLHTLTGTEIEMQWMGGGITDGDGESDGIYWACPICLSDGYLQGIDVPITFETLRNDLYEQRINEVMNGVNADLTKKDRSEAIEYIEFYDSYCEMLKNKHN
jgi:hypothetical protein